MDERLALLTGRDVNINGPRLSCAVKLSSVVSFTASPFRPWVDAPLVPEQLFPAFSRRRSRHLRLELCALSPTCSEIPHRHTANPSQFSRLILSPITDAARSRVDTSCRGTGNTTRPIKESKKVRGLKTEATEARWDVAKVKRRLHQWKTGTVWVQPAGAV